jgi:hypothetical protein
LLAADGFARVRKTRGATVVIVTARRVVAEVVERLGEVNENVELAWIGGRRRGDPLAIQNGAACPLFVRLVGA